MISISLMTAFFYLLNMEFSVKKQVKILSVIVLLMSDYYTDFPQS